MAPPAATYRQPPTHRPARYQQTPPPPAPILSRWMYKGLTATGRVYVYENPAGAVEVMVQDRAAVIGSLDQPDLRVGANLATIIWSWPTLTDAVAAMLDTDNEPIPELTYGTRLSVVTAALLTPRARTEGTDTLMALGAFGNPPSPGTTWLDRLARHAALETGIRERVAVASAVAGLASNPEPSVAEIVMVIDDISCMSGFDHSAPRTAEGLIAPDFYAHQMATWFGQRSTSTTDRRGNEAPHDVGEPTLPGTV